MKAPGKKNNIYTEYRWGICKGKTFRFVMTSHSVYSRNAQSTQQHDTRLEN